MTVLASTTIALAAIPLLSMLSLFGISAFVLNRRAACIDRERGRAEEEHAKTIRDEQEAEQTFVDSLLNGRSVPESVSLFLKRRESLLPGMVPDQPGHWDSDHLERKFQARLAAAAERANHRAALHAALSSLVLISVCVVAMSVLYGFQPVHDATTPSDASPAIPSQSPSQTATEIGGFAPLTPEMLAPDPEPLPALSPAPPTSSTPLEKTQPIEPKTDSGSDPQPEIPSMPVA